METRKNMKNHNTNASNNHEESSEENEKISESIEKTLDSNEIQSKLNENEDRSNSNEKLESNKNTSKNKEEARKKYFYNCAKVYSFFLVCLFSVLMAVFVERYNKKLVPNVVKTRPTYYAYSEEGQHLLKHVHIVLERLGYEQAPENSTDWDLFWSRDFPFTQKLSYQFNNLKEYQKINHIPGISFMTQKHTLSVSKNKYIPRSFLLPAHKEEFLNYAKDNPDALFVQKSNTHRGVKLKNASDMDFSGESFAQEFVKNPLLIDGYKFDIGIYMVLASVDPLRIYWYKEDVLLRFCRHKYYPFNPHDLNQYVIEDNYRPTWEIPSLAYYINGLGLGMKGSFDSYMRTLGIDSEKIWNDVSAAIADVFLEREHHFFDRSNIHPRSLFDLLRVDLMLDENYKVYLVEINFSPNLVAEEKPKNQLLYEQVLYNTFKLTGLASRYKAHKNPESPMISAPKNIATWGAECASNCVRCDVSEYCALCTYCRTKELTDKLMAIHTENLNKGAFRRLFPPRLEPGNTLDAIMPTIRNLTESNRLLYLWYQGKCNDDVTWCF